MGRGKRVYRLGCLDGDGIGPEIVPATVRIVNAAAAAAGVEIEWTNLPYGAGALAAHGSAVPESTLAALGALDGWVLGPHDNAGYPRDHVGPAPGGVIRRRFDLYANIRPARAVRSIDCAVPGMDLVVVRENTEGFYSDRNMAVGSGEFKPTDDVALSVGVFTRTACRRIARAAFDLAMQRGKHLTIAHKANVLPLSTGMLRDEVLAMAPTYPEVYVECELVDSLAANLVRKGAEYDVIVTENLFGDILSDLAGALAGSVGAAPSLNASATRAMAQAAHGAAPDIAGRNRANPTALILSAAMLLRWLGDRAGDAAVREAADRIDGAVRTTIEAGQVTADLGGRASTGEFVEFVLARVRSYA